MAMKRLACIFMCSGCCWMWFWIPAFLLSAKWGNDVVNEDLVSFPSINKIADDWDRYFITSITVTEEF